MGWNDVFIYDSGNLVWAKNFGSRARKGMVAGHVNSSNGYINVRFDGKYYKSHRIVWEMINGDIDDAMFIDHINHNRSDNRIENLRLVTKQWNAMNQSIRFNNKTGVIGVSWVERLSKYVSKIRVNGRDYHLGCFSDIDDAKAARIKAEIEHGFHENHGK
ncbi:HNH endonuclease signature motif containing protein [Streptomyces lividans]